MKTMMLCAMALIMGYCSNATKGGDTTAAKYDLQKIKSKIRSYIPSQGDKNNVYSIPKGTLVADVGDYYALVAYDTSVYVKVYSFNDPGSHKSVMEFYIFADTIISKKIDADLSSKANAIISKVTEILLK